MPTRWDLTLSIEHSNLSRRRDLSPPRTGLCSPLRALFVDCKISIIPHITHSRLQLIIALTVYGWWAQFRRPRRRYSNEESGVRHIWANRDIYDETRPLICVDASAQVKTSGVVGKALRGTTQFINQVSHRKRIRKIHFSSLESMTNGGGGAAQNKHTKPGEKCPVIAGIPNENHSIIS